MQREVRVLHVYFLSYAAPFADGSDEAVFVNRFDSDLRTEVGLLLGRSPSEVGFRDSRQLGPGTANWSSTLEAALQDSAIGVVLLSPSYFSPAKKWCRWEFMTFDLRNRWASENTYRKPKLLVPVPWVPFGTEQLPGNFPRELQLFGSNQISNEVEINNSVTRVAKIGVLSALKLSESSTESSTDYKRFLFALSKYVKDQYSAMDRQELESLRMTRPSGSADENTWEQPASEAKYKQAPSARSEIRRRSAVVCLAAQPEEVPLGRDWRYSDDGDADWRPFVDESAPDRDSAKHSIRFLLDSNVDEKLDYTPTHYFSKGMDAAIDRHRHVAPLLLTLDPWTIASIETYKKTLTEAADKGLFAAPYVGTIILWNQDEPEIVEIQSKVEEYLQVIVGQDLIEHVINGVRNSEEFIECSKGVLKTLRRRIRHKLTDQSRHGGSPLPRINPAG